MATEVLKPVSGNASQAVANDDFEAYQREANREDLRARGLLKEETVEPKPKVEEPKPKVEPLKPNPNKLSYKELRDRVKAQEAEIQQLKARKVEEPPKQEVVEEEPKDKEPEPLRARPKSDDVVDGKLKYKTWQEYEDDLLAWNKEVIFKELDERNAKLTREQQVEAANKTIEQSWRERVTKAREAHADFDEVALSAEGPGKLIQPGSWVDEWLMDSENGAELLYYFGQHPEELLKFQDVDKNFGGTPTTRRAAARRALVRLEDKLTAAAASSKPKSEEEEPPTPRVTKAPKPTAEVGGRGDKLPDPVAAAIADGSDAAVGRYIEEQNRRDIRQRFGDRR